MPPSSTASCRIVSGLSELAPDYDVALCDVWGVVHDGRSAFEASTDALRRFRDGGGTVVLLTNAPRPNGPVIAQIDGLGVPRDAYDAVVTSGDVTIGLVAARGTAPLFHVGPTRDLALFDEVRRRTGVAPKLAALEQADIVVCTGLFDDSREGPDDYAPLFATMRERGLDMICGNPDIVVHVGDKLIYCGGALAQRFESLGGRAFYAGKPHPPIYDLALDTAARLRGGRVDPARVLAIGDGMRTDIAGARRRDLDALFVTSGIHRADTAAHGRLDRAALESFLADAPHAPTAAADTLVW